MIAEFGGMCPECGGRIEPGQMIVSEAGARWTHASCPPGRLDLVREVCDACFTERSVTGACMCEATS